MRIFLATLLILFSHQSALGADDPAWFKTVFKKENPNELVYEVVGDTLSIEIGDVGDTFRRDTYRRVSDDS